MIWQIAEFYFDEDSQLLSGPTGESVLEPKVAAMLTYFCHNSGRDISRDELLTAVWPQQVVTDNTINRVVLLLRKAFKDEHKVKRFVVTRPKVGYRFIATPQAVQHMTAHSTAHPRPTTHWWWASLLLLLLPWLWWLQQPTPQTPSQVSPLIRLAGGQFNASMSPNGQHLLYTTRAQHEGQTHNTVFLSNPDHAIPIQISPDGGHANFARWSHQGREFVYVYNDANGCQFHLVPFTAGMAGSPQTIYSCQPNGYTQVVFSADDQQLLFLERETPFAPLEVYGLDLNTGNKRRLSQPDPVGLGNHYLDVHPATGAVLLLSDQQPGISSLFKLNIEDHSHEALITLTYSLNTAIWGHQQNTVIHPSIHPAFELIQTELNNGHATTIHADSRRVDQPQRIAGEDATDYLFTSYVHNRDIHISDHPDTAFNSSVMDYLPTLSHDGDQLAFVSKRSGDSQIWLKKLHEPQLTAIEPTDTGRVYYGLSWSHDDRLLVANTNTGLLVIDVEQARITTSLSLPLPAYAVGWLGPEQLVYSHYQDQRWQAHSHQLTTQQTTRLNTQWAMLLSNGQQQIHLDQQLQIKANSAGPITACGAVLYRYALTLELDGEDLYCRSREDHQKLLKIAADGSITKLSTTVEPGEFYSVARGRIAQTVMSSAHSDIMRTHFKP